MLATSLVRAIVKRGGTAAIVERDLPYLGAGPPQHEVVGSLNGHDVHMYGTRSSYFTTRHESKRGQHDAWSDYNPGGRSFWSTLKSLDYCG